jgi:hypothetical protein
MSVLQRPTLFAPKLRQRVRVGATAGATPLGGGVWNDVDPHTGGLGVCSVVSGTIQFSWAPAGRPPFDYTVTACTGTPSEPRFTWDLFGRIHLVYTDTGLASVRECVSDDDGRTWEDGAVSFAGGTHAHVFRDANGTLLWTAYVGGKIYGMLQEPGGDLGAAFTLKDTAGIDVAVADDQYCITQQASDLELLQMHVTISGEGSSSHWWSSDMGKRWDRYS